MLIKKADDKQARLAELEQRMQLPGHEGKQAKDDFYRLKAGIKGEKDSAYFIDFDYGDTSKNWAVIHDLRLEHKGRVAQIDHLLINRWFEIYVLETKHFNSGIKITEDGEFLRWNDWKKSYEGMESPLSQNERHIAVLKDVCAAIDGPARLGIRLQPAFHSYVLIAIDAKVYRPKTAKFDTSRVIKADQLKSNIDKEIDAVSPASILLLKAPKMVSAETVHDFARQLVAQHKPLQEQNRAEKPKPTADSRPSLPGAATIPAPACKSCCGLKGSIQYGQYGYYFKCDGCNINTAIRFSCKPGHKPKLRKTGLHFFRDCTDCGSSEAYFTNGPST